jgi:hypothetical protein
MLADAARRPRPARGSECRGRRWHWSRRVSVVLGTLGGVLVGVLAFEVALRQVHGTFPRDGFYETRQYAEGTSVARYANPDPPPLSWRMTGNESIAGAPTIVIIGDSYMAARHVSDQGVVASWIERWSRERGRPLNVRQYGIFGASAPSFAGFASRLLERWHPEHVIVVLTSNDLEPDAFVKSPYWRVTVGSDGAPAIVEAPHGPPGTALGPLREAFRAARLRSSLAEVLTMRWDSVQRAHAAPPRKAPAIVPEPARPPKTVAAARVVATPPPRAESGREQDLRVARVSVSLLKRAYGSRLLIAFLPEVTIRTDRPPTREELELARLCRAEGIPYASGHDAFMRMRDRFVYSRGFHNTQPGHGHLNERGQRAFAEIVWGLLESVR